MLGYDIYVEKWKQRVLLFNIKENIYQKRDLERRKEGWGDGAMISNNVVKMRVIMLCIN